MHGDFSRVDASRVGGQYKESMQRSIDRPYLSLALDLDPSIVSSVIVETALPASRAHISARAIDVSPVGSNLLDAIVRLVRPVDSPSQARIMQPLVTREIVYRLLMGAQRDRLRHLTQPFDFLSLSEGKPKSRLKTRTRDGVPAIERSAGLECA
jgi:AraC-type transcriptional regulator N-terminus